MLNWHCYNSNVVCWLNGKMNEYTQLTWIDSLFNYYLRHAIRDMRCKSYKRFAFFYLTLMESYEFSASIQFSSSIGTRVNSWAWKRERKRKRREKKIDKNEWNACGHHTLEWNVFYFFIFCGNANDSRHHSIKVLHGTSNCGKCARFIHTNKLFDHQCYSLYLFCV